MNVSNKANTCMVNVRQVLTHGPHSDGKSERRNKYEMTTANRVAVMKFLLKSPYAFCFLELRFYPSSQVFHDFFFCTYVFRQNFHHVFNLFSTHFEGRNETNAKKFQIELGTLY